MTAVAIVLGLAAAGFLHCWWRDRRRGRHRIPITRTERPPIPVRITHIDITFRLANLDERIATHPDLIALDRHMDEIRRAWARRGQ